MKYTIILVLLLTSCSVSNNVPKTYMESSFHIVKDVDHCYVTTYCNDTLYTVNNLKQHNIQKDQLYYLTYKVRYTKSGKMLQKDLIKY